MGSHLCKDTFHAKQNFRSSGERASTWTIYFKTCRKVLRGRTREKDFDVILRRVSRLYGDVYCGSISESVMSPAMHWTMKGEWTRPLRNRDFGEWRSTSQAFGLV